jgi:hypothetical protein
VDTNQKNKLNHNNKFFFAPGIATMPTRAMNTPPKIKYVK